MSNATDMIAQGLQLADLDNGLKLLTWEHYQRLATEILERFEQERPEA